MPGAGVTDDGGGEHAVPCSGEAQAVGAELCLPLRTRSWGHGEEAGQGALISVWAPIAHPGHRPCPGSPPSTQSGRASLPLDFPGPVGRATPSEGVCLHPHAEGIHLTLAQPPCLCTLCPHTQRACPVTLLPPGTSGTPEILQPSQQSPGLLESLHPIPCLCPPLPGLPGTPFLGT